MAKGGVVKIANHHTARISFPRTASGGVVITPLFLDPGIAKEVDADIWNRLKKSSMVQTYIRKGMISEVKKVGSVAVDLEPSSNLVIPEHLLTDEEEVQGVSETAPKAKVRRKTRGQVKIG